MTRTPRRIQVVGAGLLGALGGLVPPALAQPTDGLLAHYPFDGSTGNAAGPAPDGTPHGGVGFEPGFLGQALACDGATAWVLVQHAGALTFDLDSEPFTLACYLRADPAPTGEGTVLQDRYEPQNTPVSYNITAYTSECRIVSNSWYGSTVGLNYAVAAHAPYLGRWLHVTVTYDGMVKRLYLNGLLRDQEARPAPEFTPNGGGATTVGAGDYGGTTITNHYQGLIDELRIYDRALTPEEVAQLSLICPTDWDADGLSNSNDIAAYLSGWLGEVAGGPPCSDFDGSGAVDSSDISAFLTAWLDGIALGC